jgi:hypothetical protein
MKIRLISANAISFLVYSFWRISLLFHRINSKILVNNMFSTLKCRLRNKVAKLLSAFSTFSTINLVKRPLENMPKETFFLRSKHFTMKNQKK